MINAIVALISLFMMITSPQESQGNNDYGINEDSIVLKKLDISANSLILNIINDVLSECESTETGNVYSLYIKDYKSGMKVYIVQEHKDRIDRVIFKEQIGYLTAGKDTIIVTGKHIPDFRYSIDPKPLLFHTHDYMRNDSPELLYFIKDGIFARDGESMGWIWHIPSERLKDYELTKFAITAPKRTKK